jgi:hypothetical protein
MNKLVELVYQAIQRCNQLEVVIVGYSVNNRRFSKVWFSSVAAACQRSGCRLVILLVDEPYAFNIAARRGRTSPSAEELACCRETGDQRAVMVRRALVDIPGLGYKILRWPSLSNSTVVGLFRHELESAVRSSTVFKSVLLSYVERWGRFGEHVKDAFLSYLFEEIPVFSAFYFSWTSVLDVYPGEHFDLYIELPSGKWKKILPLMTKYSLGKHLVCIDTSIL